MSIRRRTAIKLKKYMRFHGWLNRIRQEAGKKKRYLGGPGYPGSDARNQRQHISGSCASAIRNRYGTALQRKPDSHTRSHFPFEIRRSGGNTSGQRNSRARTQRGDALQVEYRPERFLAGGVACY